MKAKQIQIPNPCKEDWSAMTPQSNGRHCLSCDTVVRDYSTLSDTQIAFILQRSKGEMCGHFRESQLNRSFAIPKEQRSPDLLAVVLGMSLLFTATPAISSPAPPNAFPSISLIEMLDAEVTHPADGHEHIYIRFHIVDKETGEELPFMKLVVMDENEEVVTGGYSDEDGFVFLKLSPDQMEMAHYFMVQTHQYDPKVWNWNPSWKTGHFETIELENWDTLIDGMMIVLPEEESKDKGIFKRKKD